MTDDSFRVGDDLPKATLGKHRETPFTYTPGLLEAVSLPSDRPFTGQHQWVSLRCDRFTSLCPMTGQPDWARLWLHYVPDRHLVESKSLKEYLNSFRQHGGFHEDVCRVIVDDLVACIQPRYLELDGQFDARGSIAIWPHVQWARPDDAWALALQTQRFAAWSPGRQGGGAQAIDGLA